MRILFVTTDFYPRYGTTVNIISNLIFNGLQNKNNMVDVLTLKQSLLELEEQCIDGVNIYRATSWLYLKKEEILFLIKKKKILLVIYALVIKIWKKIALNGNELLKKETVNALRKKLSKIKAYSYDFIIPIAADYDTVCAVEDYLHKDSRAKMVIYQVDPCSTNYNRKERETGIAKKFEEKMYSKADAILTMPCIYNDIKIFINDSNSEKFHIVELPLVTPMRSVKYKNKENTERKLICLFSGNIYGGIRDPEYIIKLFSEVKVASIAELHFVGNVEEKYLQSFEEAGIVYHGAVDIQEAENFMNNADILVNIGNKMMNQIPSKIFNYISTGKPIISTYKNKDCPSCSYLERYPLAINFIEEEALYDRHVEKLIEFMNITKNKVVTQMEILDLFNECTPSFCANQLIEILKSI